MTERAAELGGSCAIADRGDGGLVVRAVLPLDAPQPHGSPVEVAP